MIEPAGELTLLDRVEEYLTIHNCPPTCFGRSAVGTPSLVARMRAGKTLRRTTIERIEVFLASTPVRRVVPKVRPMTLGQYKAHRYRQTVARNIRDDLAERERRFRDPCEHAATFLRSRGWRVFRENEGGWWVGSMRKSDPELQAMAMRHGWRG